MAYLVANKELFDEISCTPDIEGGVGGVRIDGANCIEGADGRCMCGYPWAEVDLDWLRAYTANVDGAMVCETLEEAGWVTKGGE